MVRFLGYWGHKAKSTTSHEKAKQSSTFFWEKKSPQRRETLPAQRCQRHTDSCHKPHCPQNFVSTIFAGFMLLCYTCCEVKIAFIITQKEIM